MSECKCVIPCETEKPEPPKDFFDCMIILLAGCGPCTEEKEVDPDAEM